MVAELPFQPGYTPWMEGLSSEPERSRAKPAPLVSRPSCPSPLHLQAGVTCVPTRRPGFSTAKSEQGTSCRHITVSFSLLPVLQTETVPTRHRTSRLCHFSNSAILKLLYIALLDIKLLHT